jgi:hypothetical protein
VDGYVPDHFVFLVNKKLKAKWVDTVTHWIPLIVSEYSSKKPEIVLHEFKETDFSSIKNAYKELVCSLKKEGQVAVDITPGRKYMSAIAMEIGLSMEIDHVYYLHLSDYSYENSPYPLVPLTRHELIDMNREFDNEIHHKKVC